MMASGGSHPALPSESREPDPEDPVTSPQLGAFDGVLVDGHLLPQCEVLGGQDEPGQQECPDQKIDRLDDAHEKVSQRCPEQGDSTSEKAGHQISQVLDFQRVRNF